MAGGLPRRSSLFAVLALLTCGPSSAHEQCAVDDNVALHQGGVRLRLHGAESDAGADVEGFASPSKSMVTRAGQQLHKAMDGALRRVQVQLKLPVLPDVMRWELAGRIASWAIDLYQKPRKQPEQQLLNSLIDFSANLLGSKDIAKVGAAEYAHRLWDFKRLHQMAKQYFDQVGATPAIQEVLDATANAAEAQSHGAAPDMDALDRALLDVAKEVGGPSLVGLIEHAKKIGEGKETLDYRILDYQIPLLVQLGAPPAVADFLRDTQDMERRHVARDVLDEYVRAFRSMAEGTRQLKMPSAVAETLDYIADATKEVGHVHLEEKPELAKKILARFGELRAKLNEQLGAPPAITELDRRLAAPLMDKPGPDSAEVAGLLAQASRQMSLPSVIPELFEYLGPIAAKGSAPEPQKLQGLLLRLAKEAGAPEAVMEFGEHAAALSRQTGGAADTAKLTQMVAQLLRKLGMPAFANIFSKVAAPMLLRGKQPDPLTLALVAPSLAKVLPESEMASSILNDMRAKLLKPVLKGYETAVERLTENMPDSVLKTGFKQLLALSLGVSG